MPHDSELKVVQTGAPVRSRVEQPTAVERAGSFAGALRRGRGGWAVHIDQRVAAVVVEVDLRLLRHPGRPGVQEGPAT